MDARHHHHKIPDPNCIHLESGLRCKCVKNNAECLLCKGWFTTPSSPKKETWAEYEKKTVEKLLMKISF